MLFTSLFSTPKILLNLNESSEILVAPTESLELAIVVELLLWGFPNFDQVYLELSNKMFLKRNRC